MKKLVYSVLVALVIFGSVDAKVYTNKTFLMPRSHNENLAMEYTGWHKQFREIDENRWGGTFQATGFYQASTNKTDLGKYFGMYNNATGPNVTNPYAGQIMDFIFSNLFYPQGASTTNNEVAFLPDASFMIHDATISLVKADYWDVKATFRPKHTSYGVRFDYHQKLDKLAKGLFFKVTVPVVHVKHDMNVCYTGDRLSGKVPGTTKTVTLADYLSGKFENTEHPNKQLKLTHAKIGGGTTATSGTGTDCGSKKIAGCGDGGMTKTGVADVDVYLGYNFLYKEHKHLGVNLCLTIPTNNTPRGEWLFEPVLGLAGHWALGGGLDCAFEIWQHENMSLEFIGAVNYKYVLDETEKRTLGFKYNDSIGQTNIICTAGKRVGFGHYRLGGQRGEKCLFPLANVLTRDVGVQPGSRSMFLLILHLTGATLHST